MLKFNPRKEYRQMKTKKLAALLVLAMAGSSFAAEKVTLKNSYRPGTQVMTYSLEQARNVSGKQQRKPMRIAIAMELRIEKPAAARQVIHVTYKRFKQVAESVGWNYDSADDRTKDSPIAQAFTPLLDKTIDVILGPDGKVKEVNGMDKIWETVDVDNQMAATALQGLKQQFDKRMFSQMLNMSDFLPKGPVAPGDTWTINDDVNIPRLGIGNLKTDCRLKDVEDGIATIEMLGKRAGDQNGVKYDAEKNSTMKLDVAKGQVTERRLNQTIKVQGTAGGRQVNMETTAKIKLTFKPGKYVAPVIGSEGDSGTPAAKPESK